MVWCCCEVLLVIRLLALMVSTMSRPKGPKQHCRNHAVKVGAGFALLPADQATSWQPADQCIPKGFGFLLLRQAPFDPARKAVHGIGSNHPAVCPMRYRRQMTPLFRCQRTRRNDAGPGTGPDCPKLRFAASCTGYSAENDPIAAWDGWRRSGTYSRTGEKPFMSGWLVRFGISQEGHSRGVSRK